MNDAVDAGFGTARRLFSPRRDAEMGWRADKCARVGLDAR
jgi:hypothetical protein